MNSKTLYERLGGYDVISAVVDDLLPRLRGDAALARFWKHSGEDRLKRSKQLLIDFICSSSGGSLFYSGRDMKVTHKGMGISEADWSVFMRHLNATLDTFKLDQTEREGLLALLESTKADMVEV